MHLLHFNLFNLNMGDVGSLIVIQDRLQMLHLKYVRILTVQEVL